MNYSEYKNELIQAAMEKDPSLKSKEEAVMFTSGIKALLAHFKAREL